MANWLRLFLRAASRSVLNTWSEWTAESTTTAAAASGTKSEALLDRGSIGNGKKDSLDEAAAASGSKAVEAGRGRRLSKMDEERRRRRNRRSEGGMATPLDLMALLAPALLTLLALRLLSLSSWRITLLSFLPPLACVSPVSGE